MKKIFLLFICLLISSCGAYTERNEWDTMYYTEMNNEFVCSNSTMKIVKGGC